jgi:hypothetical protein
MLVASSVATARAQTPAAAKLLVTVVDQSGGVIPGASVTVSSGDSGPTVASVKASDRGLGTVENLPPGRYTIRAEFPGFEPGQLKGVQLRGGDNRHVIVLKLSSVKESVQVEQDKVVAAANPRTAFGATLTPEEIKGLSDDPAEMAQQLIDMAGGNAVIKVDSFVGGPLPPKALIRSIHIVRDTFAAENHSAEADEIDIVTQPGVGPVHGGGRSRLRDGSMSGRSPFADKKGPEQIQNYDVDLGGTVVPQKASFSLSGGSRRSYDTPIFTVALPEGTQSGILNVRRPSDGWTTYDLFDYALTRDQIFRVSYDQSNSTRENLGIGGYNLPGRAYTTSSKDYEVRLQESGPIGRRMFHASRLELHWFHSASHSTVEAPTIQVTESFTSGGAQVAGGRRDLDYEYASDLDYVRGKHTFRTGILLEGGWFKTDDSANYLGTYSFTSLQAYDAGRPATFTIRIGNPLIDYAALNAGLYFQDDFRIRKGLTLSAGVRYEAQTHVSDYNNFGPRAGITWAPFKSGRTTLRGSVGVFYNWLNTGVYEQTLRVDGVRQQELIVDSPPFPIAGGGGIVPPVNRYQLSPELAMPRNVRVSAGIDQALTPKVRLSVSYSRLRFSDVLRGRNMNAPVSGVRPDPSFANVIEVTADGRTHSQQIQTNLTVNLTPKGKAAEGVLNWRRATIRGGYTLSKAENNSDGPFAVPATGTLSTEWGPALNDRRHRGNFSITSLALQNLSATFRVEGSTGAPYNITTGLDNNGDLIFNDRPAATPRNAARTTSQITPSLNLAYAISLGAPRSARDDEGRYRLGFTVQIANLTNRSNYTGYSGVMTSTFFRQATAVQNPRKIDIGVNFTF